MSKHSGDLLSKNLYSRKCVACNEMFDAETSYYQHLKKIHNFGENNALDFVRQFRLQKLCREAINKWGFNFQALMVIEETLELGQAISHFLRFKNDSVNVIEEAIDVELMIEQLKIMIPSNKWDSIKKQSITHLEDLLKEGVSSK